VLPHSLIIFFCFAFSTVDFHLELQTEKKEFEEVGSADVHGVITQYSPVKK